MGEAEQDICQAPPELRREIDNQPLTRVRYLELAAMAKQLVDLAAKMGVRPSEGCQLKDLCQSLWRLPN